MIIGNNSYLPRTEFAHVEMKDRIIFANIHALFRNPILHPSGSIISLIESIMEVHLE